MSKISDAMQAEKTGKELKKALGICCIPETGSVAHLDDGTAQGTRFVGFVIRKDLLDDDPDVMKRIEEILNDTLLYVQGAIVKRSSQLIDNWVDQHINLGVEEAKTALEIWEKRQKNT
jgi:hypothetical protein